MWANRITLDYIHHDAAREKVKQKLSDIGAIDNWITELDIHCDSGYVYYVIKLFDKTQWTIFDDGNELNKQ